jgi:hypothetical protein
MKEVLEEMRSDRSGFDMPDGIPRCTVDLLTVHYPYDLADHVTPAWDEAGIEYQCYSSSRRGVLMMIGDPARRDEAARIALYYQLQLERHFSDFGVPELELTVGGRRIGIARRAGRTLTLSIDDDASIRPGEMRDVVREGELYAGLLLGALLNEARVIGLPQHPDNPEELPAFHERIRLGGKPKTAEEVRAIAERIKAKSAGVTATVDSSASDD